MLLGAWAVYIFGWDSSGKLGGDGSWGAIMFGSLMLVSYSHV
jgi:hypothetical protein